MVSVAWLAESSVSRVGLVAVAGPVPLMVRQECPSCRHLVIYRTYCLTYS